MAQNKRSFYGKRITSDWGVRLKRKEKEYKKCPISNPFKARLNGVSSQWRVFKKQAEAFSFARAKSAGLCLFSFESKSLGKCGNRLYLVCSYEHFWHYYSQLDTVHRHHYEIIPEGSACHLYFDLEFYLLNNPNKNGDLMVDIFMKYINSQLELLFDVTCGPEHVLRLSASTPEKFSKHLIYHIPAAIFKDNIHAGNFVNKICDELITSTNQYVQEDEQSQLKRPRVDLVACDNTENTSCRVPIPQEVLTSSGLTESDLAQLVVKNKNGVRALFCDTGVYTKNRNFRLYLSSKLGKINPLKVDENNRFPVAPVAHDLTVDKPSQEKEIFLDSLIANVQFQEDMQVLYMSHVSQHGKSPLAAPMKPNIWQSEKECKESGNQLEGHYQSPYPEVDRFVTSLLDTGGNQGHIRHWTYFSTVEVLCYDITGNRWCRNIGRQHKSNNVYYIADLKQAVCYQKCHDPQCKTDGFRSQDIALPEAVLPAFYMAAWEETEEVELSDTQLLSAVLQLEETEANKIYELFEDEDDEVLLKAVDSLEGI